MKYNTRVESVKISFLLEDKMTSRELWLMYIGLFRHTIIVGLKSKPVQHIMEAQWGEEYSSYSFST
jgi:hypothetical protein